MKNYPEVSGAISEIKAYLNEAKSYLNALRGKEGKEGKVAPDIQQVIEFINRVSEVLSKPQEDLEKGLFLLAVEKYISSNRHITITLKNLHSAVRINKEFSHPAFLSRLVKVFSDPSIYLIEVLDRNSILVQIKPEKVAGSVEDWRQAVEAVREILRRRGGLTGSQELRLHFWIEKLYRPAREGGRVIRRKFDRTRREYVQVDVTERQIEKYWWTIRTRLDFSRGIAPFWEILNYGYAVYGSEPGYPVNRPTNFVERSEEEIRKEILQRAKSEISRFQEKVKRLSSLITDLRQEIVRSSAVEEIKRRLGNKLGIVSVEKLQNLISQILSGEPVQVTKRGVIELTAPGRERVRLSLKSIASRFGIPLVYRR